MRHKQLLFINLLFLLMLIVSCNLKKEYSHSETEFVNISTYQEDSQSVQIIKEYKKGLSGTVDRVIGYSSMDMSLKKPESLMSNFMADFAYDIAFSLLATDQMKTQSDVVLLNFGGIRNVINRGAVSVGNVTEIMPFENKFVVVTLSGKQFKKMLNYIAKEGGQPIAGMELVIKKKKILSAKINGEPFDIEKKYRVLTSDYLFGGGDNMTFFADNLEVYHSNVLIREAMINYIEKMDEEGKKLSSRIDNRIIIE